MRDWRWLPVYCRDKDTNDKEILCYKSWSWFSVVNCLVGGLWSVLEDSTVSSKTPGLSFQQPQNCVCLGPFRADGLSQQHSQWLHVRKASPSHPGWQWQVPLFCAVRDGGCGYLQLCFNGLNEVDGQILSVSSRIWCCRWSYKPIKRKQVSNTFLESARSSFQRK